MPFMPERPVTIEKVRFGERWFPFLFRMPDGLLVMTIEYNFDTHWAPNLRIISADNGRTWAYPTDYVPRVAWCHPFADGELFEIDSYGIRDPQKGDAVYFGAWSHPARPNDAPCKEFVRMRGVTQRGMTLAQLRGCPTHPWWNLWNTLLGKADVSAEDVIVFGPYLTSGVEMPDGRLIAAGYWSHCAIYESHDRGHTWDEVGIISDPAQGGPEANETALQLLPDGRLYAVMRTENTVAGYGGQFTHAWSEDDGRTWTALEPLALQDEPDHRVGCAWPAMTQLANGTLVLAYGRPGKNLVFDPTGTGTGWQGRLDLHAWELDTQALNGVPPAQRLRGVVGEDWSKRMDRHTDSGDYLGVVAIGERELLVVYDVHAYVENWNAYPVNGVRMVKVRLT
ncbi:MAG: sialidase family protein [Armatimonadota bacterium]